MKVLHMMHTLDWAGGIETYLLSLMPMLQAQGHPQAVAYVTGNGSLADRSYGNPTLSAVGRRSEAEAYLFMQRLLDLEMPDVVHVHNVHNIGAITACLERVPTVATTHNYQFICPKSDLFLRRTRDICQRSCGLACLPITMLNRCMSPRPRFAYSTIRLGKWFKRHTKDFAHLISPSSYTAERFVKTGFPRERVTVIPYFCPLEPLAEPRPEPEKKTILFIGRIRPYKGYDYFVEALGELPGVEGVIVGDLDDRTRQEIGALARTSGCEDRLTLQPWVDREGLDALLARISVMVFPSLSPETLGIVGLEAMARGIPVVSADVGGVREWLIDGVTGKLVPPKDSRAIASAVREMLANDTARQSMGREGLALMRGKFSPQKHMDTLLGVYSQATATGVA